MKTIIAGSRNIVDYDALQRAVESSGLQITEVVSGHANGVDKLGERWARENGVKLTKFPPDWCAYGRKAGVLRNREMAKYAEAAIILWDGKSRGTANMIEAARKRNLKVYLAVQDQRQAELIAKE